MGRRIRRTILLLSLVLCLASLALWVRSHYRTDAITTRRPAHGMAIRSGAGFVRVYLRTTDRGPGVEANAWQTTPPSGPFTFDDNPFEVPAHGWNWSALTFTPSVPPRTFGWERVQGSPPTGGGSFTITSGGGTLIVSPPAGARPTVGDDYLRINFPHWLPVCAFGLLPFVAAARFASTHWRRYRRLLAGTCPMCAYDLRATPGMCPECGWSIGRGRDEAESPGKPPATEHAAS